MSKLIVIAGIKRSGSTWMYNAVRLILKHAGYTVHIAGDGQYYQPDCKADYQIVKKHPYDPKLAAAADYVFTSDRDDEGIRASWERFSGERLTDEKLATWRDWLKAWQKHTCCDVFFTAILQAPLCPVVGLMDALAVDSDLRVISNELEAIRPPTDKDYDPETLLFRNHITSE